MRRFEITAVLEGDPIQAAHSLRKSGTLLALRIDGLPYDVANLPAEPRQEPESGPVGDEPDPTDADLQDEFMAAGEGHSDTEPTDKTLEQLVDFASDEAGEIAMVRGLVPGDFEGIKKSGKGGFTVADVMKAAKGAGK